MQRLSFAALCGSLIFAGCLKHETMTAEEVLKYNPRPEQIAKPDTSVRQPQAETCLAAGKLYESLMKAAQEPMQKRDYAWRAKKAYQQAGQIEPRNAAAVAGLARIDELEGNTNGAMENYRICSTYISGNKSGEAAVLHEMGLFYARMKQYDQALAVLNKAMQLEPGNRGFAMNYGFALARAGKFEESYRHFCQISNPGEAAYQVALMAKHVGNIDLSRQYAQAALQTNPQKSAEVQELLAALNEPSKAGSAEVQQVQHQTSPQAQPSNPE